MRNILKTKNKMLERGKQLTFVPFKRRHKIKLRNDILLHNPFAKPQKYGKSHLRITYFKCILNFKNIWLSNITDFFVTLQIPRFRGLLLPRKKRFTF